MLVSVKNVTKKFLGINVLDGVDFDLDIGERVAMMGPNGAEKQLLFEPSWVSII